MEFFQKTQKILGFFKPIPVDFDLELNKARILKALENLLNMNYGSNPDVPKKVRRFLPLPIGVLPSGHNVSGKIRYFQN